MWITSEFLGRFRGTATSEDGLCLWSFGLFVSAHVYCRVDREIHVVFKKC